MTHHFLNARRLLCPIPVIRTQNKIKTLQIDDILEVVGTDPGIIHDIPSWCRLNGHEILEILQKENEIIIKIKVLHSP